MESLLSRWRVHWDHEPGPSLQTESLRYGRLQACATSERFMEGSAESPRGVRLQEGVGMETLNIEH